MPWPMDAQGSGPGGKAPPLAPEPPLRQDAARPGPDGLARAVAVSPKVRSRPAPNAPCFPDPAQDIGI